MRGSEVPKYVTVNTDNSDAELPRTNPYIIDSDTDLLIRTQYYVPNDLLIKAKQLEKRNCTIKFICLCDLFMSMYYYYLNFFIGLFLSTISFSGYMSTLYYKKSLLFCYLIYQYLQTIGRFSNIFLYISYIDNNTTNNTLVVIKTGNDSINIVILILLFISQIFITYFVQEYYNLLPSNEDKRRINTYTSV